MNGSVYGGGGGGNDRFGTGTGTGAGGKVIITATLGLISSATGGTHTSDATFDYWTFTSSGIWTPTTSGGAVSAAPIIIDEQ